MSLVNKEKDYYLTIHKVYNFFIDHSSVAQYNNLI